MKLTEYLETHSIGVHDFAKRAKLTAPTIYFILKGRHNPTLRTINKITKASEGWVTFNDFVGSKP